MMRMWRFLLPLLAFLALGLLLWSGLGKDPSVLPSPLLGKPAPVFALSLLDREGQRLESAQLRGQPYLLNVWASWCVTCRAEHPVWQAYAAKLGVRLVGLNWKDDRARALEWLQQRGNPYTDVLFDPEGGTGIDFGVYGTPETFLVDAQGIVRYKHVGALDAAAFEREILPRLAALRSGEAP